MTPISRICLHALATLVAKSRWGAQLIKKVTEPIVIDDSEYQRWLHKHYSTTPSDIKSFSSRFAANGEVTKFSLIMPIYNPDIFHLKEAIKSIKCQRYTNWELCIVDDASSESQVWETVFDEARNDPRIIFSRLAQNGHICAASNHAIEMSHGEFLGFMDQDDLLHEAALFSFAAHIHRFPNAGIIYSDEDKINSRGRHYEPYFKTDWDPELILSQNMVNHLCIINRKLIEQVGGLRVGFEGAQDLDLILRVSAIISQDRIHHIPEVLYHWRQNGRRASFSEGNLEKCQSAAERSVNEHLAATGQALATAVAQPNSPGWLDVVRTPPDPSPFVSIIIPTRDRLDLLRPCLESILEHTSYSNYEIVIADNDSVEIETKDFISKITRIDKVKIVHVPGSFNFSRINNMAFSSSHGSIIVFMNNDITVTDSCWLSALVSQAVRPEVGAVGAKLLYPDGRIQHAGISLGIGAGVYKVAKNTYCETSGDFRGYANFLQTPRNVSAVSAACLAIRSSVFEDVGGFDALNLPVAFNDVDLCLRVRQRGLSVIWTPHATLTHHESASRGADTSLEKLARFEREAKWMRSKWGAQLDNDPYYGPNFDNIVGDYRLAETSRHTPSWKGALPTTNTQQS